MNDTDISVFSEEERNEINRRIEAASVREAAPPPGLPRRGETSRRGILPLLVNAGAVLALAAGVLALVAFHRSDAAEIRESGAVLGITERALIEEIRREANLRLGEKEAAIGAMNLRIAEVDAELERLDSLEALTDEQRAAMEELRRQQEEYRGSLARLEEDRARILAEARSREAEALRREAGLHVKLEEQTGVPESLSAQSGAELEAAREELAKISGEAEKAALVERQISGYYAAVTRQIEGGRYGEAAESVASLKAFLATPAFQNLKVIQTRRESDAATVAALSALIAEARKGPAGSGAGGVPEAPASGTETAGGGPAGSGPAGSGPAGAEAALRQQLAAQTAALAELQKASADLKEQNAAGQAALAERDKQLENLRAQVNSQDLTIANLRRTLSAISAQLENQ
jgi:hypothetical protein